MAKQRLCKVLCRKCQQKSTCTEACPEIIKSIKRDKCCQNIKSHFMGVTYNKEPDFPRK